MIKVGSIIYAGSYNTVYWLAEVVNIDNYGFNCICVLSNSAYTQPGAPLFFINHDLTIVYTPT